MTDKKKFPVNTNRYDPYKNAKFRVLMEGKPVAGVSKVSELKSSAVSAASALSITGGKSGGARSKFEPITLERGVTHDKDFEDWASGGARKDIVIEVLDEKGEVVKKYKVLQARVSEYQSTPDLDANANAVTIGHMKIEHEGWEVE